MIKICSCCKVEKDINLFAKHVRMKDGYSTVCKECNVKKVKDWRNKNPEKVKQQSSKWKSNNKDKVKEISCKYYLNNKEKINESNKKWKIKNKELVLETNKILYYSKKDQILSNQKEYRKTNKPKLAAKAAKERAVRGLASPKWLTNIQKMQIEWFYQAAKMMTETSGKPHHVDHIHPLQGENFNGLHVPWNLQVIPAEENIRKSNKLVGI